MIKHTYDSGGINLLRTESAIPKCGEDFCDSCGDCLYCCSEDQCYGMGGGDHFWVEYEEVQE